MNNFDRWAKICQEQNVARPQRSHDPKVATAFAKVCPRVCSHPGCGRTHNPYDKARYIELDHKDGNHYNNKHENLQWFCREHHCYKHGRISWLDLNLSNIKSWMATDDIKKQLLLDNTNSIAYSMIVEKDPSYIRGVVRHHLHWGSGNVDEQPQGVDNVSSSEYVTLEVNGITVECRIGAKITF